MEGDARGSLCMVLRSWHETPASSLLSSTRICGHTELLGVLDQGCLGVREKVLPWRGHTWQQRSLGEGPCHLHGKFAFPSSIAGIYVLTAQGLVSAREEGGIQPSAPLPGPRGAAVLPHPCETFTLLHDLFVPHFSINCLSYWPGESWVILPAASSGWPPVPGPSTHSCSALVGPSGCAFISVARS